MKKFLLAASAASALIVAASAASAGTVLYRNDLSLGTDYLGQALAASGHAVTTTAGNLSSFTLSSFDLVVYANQNSSMPGGDLGSLASFVSGGGRLIYTDWRQAGLDGAVFTGGLNQTSLTLGPLFGAGIVSPLAVTNPGWGTFSMGLAAGPGAIVAATFGNGQGAIVVGTSGRTIVNGFLNDTVASQQLYANEINYLMTSGVPEPSTWAMMLIGFAGLGLAARKRRRETAIA